MILTVQNSRIFHEFVQGLRFYKKKKSVLFVVYLVEFEEIVKFIENGFGLVWSTVLKSSDTSEDSTCFLVFDLFVMIIVMFSCLL